MRISRTRAAWAALVVALALVGAACGGGGNGDGGNGGDGGDGTPTARPSSPATVAITTPANGDAFAKGTVIPVKVDLEGGRIVKQATKDITPTTGHLHLLVDNEVVSMNYGTTQSLKDVAVGLHVLKVEYVAADHLPFDPRVVDAVTFEVTK